MHKERDITLIVGLNNMNGNLILLILFLGQWCLSVLLFAVLKNAGYPDFWCPGISFLFGSFYTSGNQCLLVGS